MRDIRDAIKKRLRQREDMFSRRLMGMLAKNTKTKGELKCQTSTEAAMKR